ncbi:MAG: glycosyltransferase, partial [Planctomycetes bacterium]|nr:glycosyltransferase [Planctomycetota bacterium]
MLNVGKSTGSRREFIALAFFILIGSTLVLGEAILGNRSTLSFRPEDPRIDLRPWSTGDPLVQEPINPITPDGPGFVLPGLIRSRQLLSEGELGWDGSQLLGYPFLGNLAYPVLYPITWIFQGWIPGSGPIDPIDTMDFMLLFHMALGGFFAYRLARMMGIEPPYAVFATIGFSFTWCVFTRFNAQQVYYTLAWWPGQAAVLVWLRRKKHYRAILELGLCTGMMFLAGFPQVALILSGVTIAAAVLDSRLWTRRALISLAAGLVLGVLLAAPQLQASRQAYKNAMRSHPETLAAMAVRGLPFPSLAGTVLPGFFGHPPDFSVPTRPAATMEDWLPQRLWWSDERQNNVVETTFYPGVMVLLLLGIAVCNRKVDGRARHGLILGVAAIGFALLWPWMAENLPFLQKLATGNVKRLLVVPSVCFPFVAAFSLSAMTRGQTRFPWLSGLILLVLIIALPILARFIDDPDAPRFADMLLHQALHQAVLVVGGGFALLLLYWSAKDTRLLALPAPWKKLKQALRWLPAMVLALDLILLARAFYPFPEQTPAYPETPEIKALAGCEGRVAVFGSDIKLLLPSAAGCHRIRSIHAVMAMVPRRGAELLSCIEGPLYDIEDPRVSRPLQDLSSLSHPLLDLLNVQVVVHDQPGLENLTGFPVLFQNMEARLGALERPGTGPRAFLCGGAKVVREVDDRLALLADRSFPVHHTVLLEQAPENMLPEQGAFIRLESYGTPPASCAAWPKEAQSRAALWKELPQDRYCASDGRFLLKVNAPFPGIMVLTEAWDPGWRVLLNGESRKPLVVDHALLGVEVGTGLQEIEFYYQPEGWTLALVLALCALAALGMAGIQAFRFRDRVSGRDRYKASLEEPPSRSGVNLQVPKVRKYVSNLGVFEGQGVSIIIPAYEDTEKLRRVLWSIEETADLPYELIISRAKQCVARNRNAGLDRSSCDLVVFMDDDVLLPAGWLSQLVAVLASDHRFGAVATLLRFPNGSPQTTRPDLGPGENWEISAPGTCFVYSRARVNDLRFDEKYQGSQWEDTDWMWQVMAMGLITVVTGDVCVIHDHALQENQWLIENMTYFNEKWGRLPAIGELCAIS